MIRLTIIIVLLFSVIHTGAQRRLAPSLDSMELDEVAQQASMLIASQKFAEAQPFLERLMRDLAGVTDNPGAARALEYATFFIGMAPYADNRMGAAIQRFEQYLSRYPHGRYAPQAVLMIAEAHASSGAWEKALPYLNRALQMPGLSPSDRPTALLMLGEGHFRLKRWESALHIMSDVLRTSRQTSEINAAALFTALCLIELDRFDDLFRFLPRLRQTEVQYDIDLNISLIEAGDKLIEEARYLEALTLYQSVFTKRELVVKAQEVLAVRQREHRLFQPSGANPARMLQRREELQRRVTEAEERLKRIQAYPDYEIPLTYRSGVCYYQLGRHWEARRLFLTCQAMGPGGELAPLAYYFYFASLVEREQWDEVSSFGKTFMKAYPNASQVPGVAKLLVEIPLAQGDYEEALNRIPLSLKQKLPPAFRAELQFTHGYILIQLERSEEARVVLQQIIKEDKGSAAILQQARYWKALSYMFSGDFQVALDAFDEFVQKYTVGGLTEDAQFRIAAANYGLGNLGAAEVRFRDFLAAYPDSQIQGEARNMLGDIVAADGRLDDAIRYFKSTIENADEIIPINYASFQLGRLYELESRWDEIIELFTMYRETYGVESEHTVATYWIVNALKQSGRDEDALSEMFNAIVRYGNDPRQYGVDMILRDLIEEVNYQTDQEGRSEVMTRLFAEMRNARENEQSTLSTRLITLFAETQPDRRSTLAEMLMFEPDIQFAAPITLNLMGSHALATGRKDFARKTFTHFLEYHTESDLALPAYRGMAEIWLEEGEQDRAEPLLQEILHRFAMFEDAAWATLRLGDLRRAQKEYEEANIYYNMVLSVKEWRGEAWAEALYKLGQLLMDQDNHREAFAYFQRVYVMYEGYPIWAARAYVASAECLVLFGRIQDAVTAYREMLNKPELRQTPVRDSALARVQELEARLQ